MTIFDTIQNWFADPAPMFGNTEQDTYDALRRLPINQLEASECCKHACQFIRRNTEMHFQEDLINNGHDDIGIHMALPTFMIEPIYAEKFVGTGWTVKEYAQQVYRRLAHEHAVKIRRKRRSNLMFGCCLLLAGITSSIAMPYIGPLWAKIIVPIANGHLWARLYLKIKAKIEDEPI